MGETYKEYATDYFPSQINNKSDLTELFTYWSHDEGYILHSITPQMDEGTTVGYVLIFERELEKDDDEWYKMN